MVYTCSILRKFLLPWGFDDDSLPLVTVLTYKIFKTNNFVIINMEKSKFSFENKTSFFLNPICRLLRLR